MALDYHIEALLFASEEPLKLEDMARYLNIPEAEAAESLEKLRMRLAEHSALKVIELAGGFRLETQAAYYDDIKAMFHDRKASRLTPAALETLALIAYKQPITAIEIAEMRMVSSVSSILKNLLEKKLVRTAGRKKVVGRPMMYATTKDFLIHFGLSSLKDLPSLEEFQENFGGQENASPELPQHQNDLPIQE